MTHAQRRKRVAADWRARGYSSTNHDGRRMWVDNVIGNGRLIPVGPATYPALDIALSGRNFENNAENPSGVVDVNNIGADRAIRVREGSSQGAPTEAKRFSITLHMRLSVRISDCS
ncbi:hypothetical protein TNCV_777691 [Trichonephila clavipes]|nr:hypothetical protein TNCV_777691 [Trichonephila clavipes]